MVPRISVSSLSSSDASELPVRRCSSELLLPPSLTRSPSSGRRAQTGRRDSVGSATARSPLVARSSLGIEINDRGHSALASRRRGSGTLTVDTQRSKRRIRLVENFDEWYDLGDEVMPSGHRGMQVLHATSRATGTAVVVKIRCKASSFRSRDEELEWRETTEFLLNLRRNQALATLHAVLEDRRAYYVVMEKVEGLDLFESLSGDGPMSVSEIKQVIRQVLMALVDLHSNGAIHKDLKLENIMVDRSPSRASAASSVSGARSSRTPQSLSVKLIDFDTVEGYSPKTPKSAKDVLGTDQYISQEAYDGNYSPASDIFALGVIAYKLLTGRFPFDYKIFNDEKGENWVGSPKMIEIREKVKNYHIRWEHRVFLKNPTCVDLVRRMLAANCEDRPTAQEALEHPWLLPAGPSRRPSVASKRSTAS